MKDAMLALLLIFCVAAMIYWADIPKAFDQDMGLYKQHHVNAVKCVIK